jgi:hypothetical protein
MLSLFMQMRKQEDSCGLGVPALKRVGEACVNQRSLSRWYVLIALSMSVLCIPTDTRMSMCWGRSTTVPFTLSKYERSRVCKELSPHEGMMLDKGNIPTRRSP